MDQAVLALVKSWQKKAFYYKLLDFAEAHHLEYATPQALFKAFLATYTVVDAIFDIFAGWESVDASTIKKSFNKAFDMKVWNELHGNILEGFEEQE